MTQKKIYKGKAECSRCGTPWLVKELTLKDGTEVRNFWCTRCDELQK